MNLIEQYQAMVQTGEIKQDLGQLHALTKLQHLSEALTASEKWWKKIGWNQSTLKGLYFWGGVGIGKTFLMDLFFSNLPTKRKLRMHFHVFMQHVHHELKRFQGQSDPLRAVARYFSIKTKVLCFDEFFVNDITDAMILGRLFEALFENGVCLVATSNVAPEKLYWKGLHRKRFLPTIDLLQQHTQIVHLPSTNDYRLAHLQQEGVFFSPLNAASEKSMRQRFELFAHGSGTNQMPIIIEQRPIATLMVCETAVWLSFDAICNIPRSQLDYIAIAKKYAVVLVSDVPQIKPSEDDKITYFINLVDVMYDYHVQLILSSEVAVERIYMDGSKVFAFERTKSRLIEMQSKEYIKKTSDKMGASTI